MVIYQPIGRLSRAASFILCDVSRKSGKGIGALERLLLRLRVQLVKCLVHGILTLIEIITDTLLFLPSFLPPSLAGLPSSAVLESYLNQSLRFGAMAEEWCKSAYPDSVIKVRSELSSLSL